MQLSLSFKTLKLLINEYKSDLSKLSVFSVALIRKKSPFYIF